jgi:predicted Zn-dependent peptidase
MANRDFRSAVNHAVGIHAIRAQVRSKQIKDLAENLLAGKGKEGYYAIPKELQDANEEDLKAIARRIFNMNTAVIVRMHGRSK